MTSVSIFRRAWHNPCASLLRMRTLLKHAPSGQYFQSLEKWTPDPSAAHDFQNIGRALRFVRKAGFADMELIVSFENPVGYVRHKKRRVLLAIEAGPQTAWSHN